MWELSGVSSALRSASICQRTQRNGKRKNLRKIGAEVREYGDDYTEAVRQGREASKNDPFSIFIDDENSLDLFIGYATAALRTKVQLYTGKIPVTAEKPLFVYIPCGVGGAPGGIAYGLKQMYGNNVHVFFAEPVEAPSFTLSMCTGNHDISIRDIGLTGATIADGLAVGKASKLSLSMMEKLVSGCFTVSEENLKRFQKAVYYEDEVYVEPSAAAGFKGPEALLDTDAGREYLKRAGLSDKTENITHLIWATGGGMVPEEIKKAELEM